MSNIIFDNQSYNPELAREGLEVVTIASTPAEGGSVILDPKLDPASNSDLKQALKIYSRHYLASEQGIPGEGEDIDVILSRLRGEDENVRRMSVVGLKDRSGKIVGVSFVESYEVEKSAEHQQGDHTTGGPTGGLVHLLTYAAVEPPHEKTATNVAFHAGILNEIIHIDKELGYTDNSILATEVNSVLGYDGKRQSNKMDPEFEVKTGAPRELRETYVLGGGEHILPLEGKHNTSHALGIRYTPPNLAGETDQAISADIKTAGDLAPLLRNAHADDGELLFLTAESPYHAGITAHDAALHASFQEALNVSVAQGNHGIDDPALIKTALREPSNTEYQQMTADYARVIAAATAKEAGKPPSGISTTGASMEDINREQQRRAGK